MADESTRIFRERAIQKNQTVVENRAKLLVDIEELRQELPERLRSAGYPENKYSAMVRNKGKSLAAYVVSVSDGSGLWIGVSPKGTLFRASGSIFDKGRGLLTVTGRMDLESEPVPILAAMKGLLEGCTSTKQFSWEPD